MCILLKAGLKRQVIAFQIIYLECSFSIIKDERVSLGDPGALFDQIQISMRAQPPQLISPEWEISCHSQHHISWSPALSLLPTYVNLYSYIAYNTDWEGKQLRVKLFSALRKCRSFMDPTLPLKLFSDPTQPIVTSFLVLFSFQLQLSLWKSFCIWQWNRTCLKGEEHHIIINWKLISWKEVTRGKEMLKDIEI